MRDFLNIIQLNESEYRGDHEAPDKDSGAPLWDVSSNGIYPTDFYQGRGREYIEGNGPGDWNSYDKVLEYHNKPNAPIKIYRAIPKSLKAKINPGDWVAITIAYANDHGRHNLRNDFRVITKTVFARDIFNDGNICEWGYNPQPMGLTHIDKENERRRVVRSTWPPGVRTGVSAWSKDNKWRYPMTPEDWDKMVAEITAKTQQENS